MKNTTADWTYEAGIAIDLCREWSVALRKDIACEVYLFGSSIYQGGDQFDAQSSDLDLVVHFNESLEASERVDRLILLQSHKKQLELIIIPSLRRTNCVEPGASILPITDFQLRANIHKSGSRRFFDKNIFLNLGTQELSVGLPNAGVVSIPDENRQALEFVQKTQNEFLSLSGNGTGGLAIFEGHDPIPKALSRFAAQLISDAAEGEWYDTRLGLESFWEELVRRRTESDRIGTLYKMLSIRRGGRGKRFPLSDLDQILLVGILADLAMATHPEPVIIWEIRFVGGSASELDNNRLASELKRLAPDAQIMKVFQGSVIIRVRSSERSFETVRKLMELGFLPRFFNVEEVSCRVPEGCAVI